MSYVPYMTQLGQNIEKRLRYESYLRNLLFIHRYH